MLKRCPNYEFEDISQLKIFHKWLRSDIKMIMDAAIGRTMMVVDVEQATKIIDALASTNYQAQHDKQVVKKKGMLDLSTSNATRTENKVLTQKN